MQKWRRRSAACGDLHRALAVQVGALAMPPFGCPAFLQQHFCIQSGYVTALEGLTAAALHCSHVSGMKIRFLTLIEELRRAGDEVGLGIRIRAQVALY